MRPEDALDNQTTPTQESIDAALRRAKRYLDRAVEEYERQGTQEAFHAAVYPVAGRVSRARREDRNAFLVVMAMNLWSLTSLATLFGRSPGARIALAG